MTWSKTYWPKTKHKQAPEACTGHAQSCMHHKWIKNMFQTSSKYFLKYYHQIMRTCLKKKIFFYQWVLSFLFDQSWHILHKNPLTQAEARSWSVHGSCTECYALQMNKKHSSEVSKKHTILKTILKKYIFFTQSVLPLVFAFPSTNSFLCRGSIWS